MEQKTFYKYVARLYNFQNSRLRTFEYEIFAGDIQNVLIPDNCLFVDIYTLDAKARNLDSTKIIKEEHYLVGQRFDRCRANFADDREKVNFTLYKVYKPHSVLDEKLIKNGKYSPQAQGSEESGS